MAEKDFQWLSWRKGFSDLHILPHPHKTNTMRLNSTKSPQKWQNMYKVWKNIEMCSICTICAGYQIQLFLVTEINFPFFLRANNVWGLQGFMYMEVSMKELGATGKELDLISSLWVQSWSPPLIWSQACLALRDPLLGMRANALSCSGPAPKICLKPKKQLMAPLEARPGTCTALPSTCWNHLRPE